HGIAVFDGIVDCLRAGHRRPDLRTRRLQVVRSVGQLDLVACRTRDRRYAGIWELGHRLVDARVTGGRDVTDLLVHDIRAGIDVIVPNDPIRKGHFGSKPKFRLCSGALIAVTTELDDCAVGPSKNEIAAGPNKLRSIFVNGRVARQAAGKGDRLTTELDDRAVSAAT